MANSTTSGVRSLGAADTSVRATSAAAKLFLRVSLLSVFQLGNTPPARAVPKIEVTFGF
jgi:hypothetical protein